MVGLPRMQGWSLAKVAGIRVVTPLESGSVLLVCAREQVIDMRSVLALLHISGGVRQVLERSFIYFILFF